MTTTPILALDELASAQAIPEVLVNENTRWLEFFAAGGKVLDRGLTAQPGSPSDGDAYLMVASPTGTNWSGQGNKIALRIGTAWEFKTPTEGMTLYVADEDVRIVYDGSAWASAAGSGGGYSPGGTDVALADGGTGASLADPNADRIMFWDDSAGAVTWLEAGTGLSISGTTITATGTGAAWEMLVAVSDETTALTVGTGKVTFRMPRAVTLTDVRASVTTAPTGSTLIVDINEGGSTILSTKLSIDASEKTSTTAASAAVISDTALADDAEITIDIDQVGSTIAGAGLKVLLKGTT